MVHHQLSDAYAPRPARLLNCSRSVGHARPAGFLGVDDLRNGDGWHTGNGTLNVDAGTFIKQAKTSTKRTK